MASGCPGMLSFRDLTFDYEPFPIGLCRPAFEADAYRSLVDAFPPLDLFGAKEDLGHKYSLSEVNHPAAYHDYVRTSAPWREFHRYVKSEDFIRQVVGALAERGIALGLERARIRRLNRFEGAGRFLASWPHAARSAAESVGMALARLRSGRAVLGARFEFSVLPGDGGHILPHTDAPQKLITLVVSMLAPDEWRAEWGGGTEVLRPRDPEVAFNKMNRYLAFDDVETIRSLPFEPNQCVVFVKTFNSLHAVSPMRGGSGVLRRTLTINIERLDTQP